MYYYTESYYDDQAIYSLDSSIIKKYKDSPRPLLVRHLKEIFWMLNPKGKGVILNTQGFHPFDKPFYLQSFKIDSHKLSVINTDYVLPYSGWSNNEFCKTCPVFTDDGNSHEFSFSPLFYFNNLFKEFYKKNTEKLILKHVNTLKFKESDSNNKKIIDDDLKIREQSLNTSSMRLLTNYLIPVKIMVPYFDNPVTKHKINHTIWFLPNEEFLNALPDSIGNLLRKELDAIKKVESGEMQPDQACKGLIPEETFFEVCKIASENIKMVDVIPNPVTNDANLKFILLEDRYVSISIHDQNGNFVKNVLDWEKLNNGEQNYHLDLNGLPAGTYIINITTDKSEKVVKRFIKI